MADFIRFPSTLWSRISLVKKQDTSAVSQFVERYRTPVLRFLVRSGLREADAEDLTQEVFARLLAENVLERADKERGKFRSFLLGVTKNVLREDRRKRSAQKRGGAQPAVSLDGENVPEPVADEPAEEEFDKEWVNNLLDLALQTLEEHEPNFYKVLQAHINGGKKYQEIAEETGKTVQAIKNLVHRARKNLMDLLQREISRYASSEKEYEEELAYLSKFLR